MSCTGRNRPSRTRQKATLLHTHREESLRRRAVSTLHRVRYSEETPSVEADSALSSVLRRPARTGLGEWSV